MTAPQTEPPEPPTSAEAPQREPEPAEERVEDVDADEPRRYPSTIGGAFYLLVLGSVGVALVLVALHEWRTGIRLMGGSLLFGALVRLVLPTRSAGMLAVRHKLLDAVVLVVLGSALIFLAGSIPDQPGF
jgi:hypothetical protein